MAKTLTLRIDDKTYSAIVKQAKTENRSLANFVETAVKAHIQESAFLGACPTLALAHLRAASDSCRSSAT